MTLKESFYLRPKRRFTARSYNTAFLFVDVEALQVFVVPILKLIPVITHKLNRKKCAFWVNPFYRAGSAFSVVRNGDPLPYPYSVLFLHTAPVFSSRRYFTESLNFVNV